MRVSSTEFSDGSTQQGDGNHGDESVHTTLSPRTTNHRTNSITAADIFSKNFSRLQEQQIIFTTKLEKEKKRKEDIEVKLQYAKDNLTSLLEKTKSGAITKDVEISNQKVIGKVEHNLQMARIKLSIARNDNSNVKKKVDDLRKEKLLHVQILNDLVRETNEIKAKIKNFQKEILHINEKKHRVKVNISSAKNKMIQDMEDFANELSIAKQNISNNQANMLGTIREKLQLSVDGGSIPSTPYIPGSSKKQTSPRQFRTGDSAGSGYDSNTAVSAGKTSRQSEITVVLEDSGFGNVEELLTALQQSEEKMFSIYNTTQEKNEEMEKLQSENKRLESEILTQSSHLTSLETRNEEKKVDLEKCILALKTSIDKYDTDFNHNMELLYSISDPLMNLLRNLAVDEAQIDQQLLSTGITDRNIDVFLGLVEQRIDDLIQMSKAANRQVIRREDFMKIAVAQDKMSGFHPPVLPSVESNDEDGDDLDIDIAGLGKVQPVNIAALKEMMNKKVQKIASMKPKGVNLNQNSNLGSRQSSKRSIRSSQSGETTGN
mmetsp:Transcript_8089/g.11360  ORF Transcript_8089/g.11360 Transcript_8089/m.11360 type:complete len:546 (+) Transcript_8089:13-1650(+)